MFTGTHGPVIGPHSTPPLAVAPPPKPTVTHHPATKTLQVKWADGRIHQIKGITAKEHAKLLHAPCLGGAINSMIMQRRGKVVEVRK